MKARGQVVIIFAFLIIIGLFLLALLVDGGRLYVYRGRDQRAAQSAADAGIGLVAERMVTLAIPRMTEASLASSCLAEGEFSAPGAACTSTPEPDEIADWLTEDDQQALLAPEIKVTVQALAVEYAGRNGISESEPAISDLQAEYPYRYQHESETIRIRVTVRRNVEVLLAGLLGQEFIVLPVEAISEVPW